MPMKTPDHTQTQPVSISVVRFSLACAIVPVSVNGRQLYVDAMTGIAVPPILLQWASCLLPWFLWGGGVISLLGLIAMMTRARPWACSNIVQVIVMALGGLSLLTTLWQICFVMMLKG